MAVKEENEITVKVICSKDELLKCLENKDKTDFLRGEFHG